MKIPNRFSQYFNIEILSLGSSLASEHLLTKNLLRLRSHAQLDRIFHVFVGQFTKCSRLPTLSVYPHLFLQVYQWSLEMSQAASLTQGMWSCTHRWLFVVSKEETASTPLTTFLCCLSFISMTKELCYQIDVFLCLHQLVSEYLFGYIPGISTRSMQTRN